MKQTKESQVKKEDNDSYYPLSEKYKPTKKGAYKDDGILRKRD